MKVMIFTEGGKEIGYGHISRCIALYDEIQNRRNEVELIIQGDLEDIVLLKGKDFINRNWISIDYLNRTLTNEDYVIVDSYNAQNEHYEIISSKSKKALYIDDIGRLQYPKGIIVNPALGVGHIDYSYMTIERVLTGPKYVILRSSFSEIERFNIRNTVSKVLVVMGATDVRGITTSIIENISSQNQDIIFDVVINAYQYEKIFIIAELSANHGHDINIAKETIKAAKEAGADAIKIQTYTADTLTIDCDNEYFKLDSGTIWDGRTLYDLYSEAYTPWEWQRELMEYANNLGLVFFSTPFDMTAVDFLEELNVPLYKVASFEIMDIPLIEYIASKGKPVIMSTGIATLSDIEDAVNACKRVGNDQIILLKCTSSYPAKIEDANLKTIPNLKETFGVEVGLSDHTIGITVPVVSVAVGARVIEKHFIIDKSIGGPDSIFSLEPHEFKQMVESVRDAEKAIGKVDYSMNENKKSSRLLGRSLFVVKDIKAGEKFTEENIRSIRPGNGLAPKYYKEVIGKRAKGDLKKGTPLGWNSII